MQDNYRDLYIAAREAAENAYAPYSRFKVGAALLTKEGKIYLGCNVENASYPAGICAERTAAAKAVSDGYSEFEAIAICGGGKEAWPCGICRQFLSEFSPQMTVITGSDENHLESISLKDLLPKGFTL